MSVAKSYAFWFGADCIAFSIKEGKVVTNNI